jgi:NTE family protein
LKARIPFSVYNIQDLDYLFMELFASSSAAADYNFDSLFVPFRCVATDIDSSELIVLKNGDLAKAVRASVTFPFYIRPIKIKDKLLFDGGMLNNFPVSVAVDEFHPDFIIGSQAVKNFPSPDADDVISQMQNMLMRKTNFNLDSLHGLVIESKTGDENVFQFQKAEQYIDSGYRATLEKIPELKRRIKRTQTTKDLFERRRKFIDKMPGISIGKISVEGLNEKQKHYFEHSLHLNQKNFNYSSLKKQYDRLLANENVRTVLPSLTFNPASESYDVKFDIKKADPFYIKFGGFISSAAVNEGYINVGYRQLGKTSKHYNVSTYFGTFYNSFAAFAKYERQGKIPFYVMLDVLASRKNYFGNARYFFEDQSPAYIVIDENYLDVNVGIPLGLSQVIRLGVGNLNNNYLYHQNNRFTRADTADQSNFYFLNPYLEFERNNLNRKQFASKGSRLYFGFNYYVGNEHTVSGSVRGNPPEVKRNHEFFEMSSHYEQYLSIFKPFIVGLSADVAYSNKPLLSNYVSSLLIASSFEPITLMKTMFLENYRAYSYGDIGVKTLFELYKHLELRLEAYYYVPYQKIISSANNQAELSKPFSYQYLVGKAQLLYHTAIGPIGVSVNYFDKDGNKLTFMLNIGWSIFNKSRFYR